MEDRPYCIKMPENRKQAGFGDIIMVAHRGKVYNALVVSNHQPSKILPRYDDEYIVLLHVDEKLEPLSARVTIPLPKQLWSFAKHFSNFIKIHNDCVTITCITI